VIDAAGRRSPIDRWLEDIDAHRTATWQAECGLAYFSRHYRVREGARPPGPLTTRSVIPLDEFIVGIWGADNGAMQLAVGPLAMDHRFKTLRHPHVFTAVLRMLPAFAAWLDALDPITEVYAMGGIHNTIRRFVVDGVPVATGVVGIGDSVCTTNPTLGRGLTLASVGAVDLRATLDAFDGDWIGLSHAIDERVADHVLPFYEDQAHIDSARLAALRHAIFGEPLPVPTPQPGDRVDFGQLRAAAAHDPTAFRALWSILAMLTRPADVYADPEIVARTRDVLRQQGTPTPTEQPSREQLLSALAATA
jgi:hypothetical protein